MILKSNKASLNIFQNAHRPDQPGVFSLLLLLTALLRPSLKGFPVFSTKMVGRARRKTFAIMRRRTILEQSRMDETADALSKEVVPRPRYILRTARAQRPSETADRDWLAQVCREQWTVVPIFIVELTNESGTQHDGRRAVQRTDGGKAQKFTKKNGAQKWCDGESTIIYYLLN